MHIVLSLECGGLEKIAIELSAKLNSGTFNSCICCLDKFGELSVVAENKNVNVILVKRKPGKDLTLPFRLARAFKKRSINLVHTHNLVPLLYGSLAAKIAGIPVVINTRHGRERKHIHSTIWNMNNALIAISKDAKNELLKWNTLPSEKVTVIYNGIDIDAYESGSQPAEAKKDLHLNPADFVVGTVARLSPEKDQRTLLAAFLKVAGRIPGAKLVVVGDGILKNELTNYSRMLGIADKVRFLGFRADINKLLPAFDVFVLSSLTEGISLTLLEAMAAGIPVIATNVGGTPEIIDDGISGFLIPPNDAEEIEKKIITLFNNKELAARFSKSGRIKAKEKFSLNGMVDKYRILYKKFLDRKNHERFSNNKPVPQFD